MNWNEVWQKVEDCDGWKLLLCSLMLHSQDVKRLSVPMSIGFEIVVLSQWFCYENLLHTKVL